MFGDIFSSTHEYIKSKLVNPFLGTLIFVWLVRNWFLVYSLFTFDGNFGWKEKTEFIKVYLKDQNFWHEVYINMGIGFALFIISLAILLITRFITNYYEFTLLPIVYKWSDKGQIVTKERYSQLVSLSSDKDKTIEGQRESLDKSEALVRARGESIDNLNNKLVDEQLKTKDIQGKYDSIENDYNELTGKYNELNKKYTVLEDFHHRYNQNTVITDLLNADYQETTYNEKFNYDALFSNIKRYLDASTFSPSIKGEMKKQTFEMIADKKILEFLDIAFLVSIENSERISIARENFKYFQTLGLFQSKVALRQSDESISTDKISLTTKGSRVFTMILNIPKDIIGR